MYYFSWIATFFVDTLLLAKTCKTFKPLHFPQKNCWKLHALANFMFNCLPRAAEFLLFISCKKSWTSFYNKCLQGRRQKMCVTWLSLPTLDTLYVNHSCNSAFRHLAGLRHDDVAVLGEFCAKIITHCFTHTQNAPVKLWGWYQMNSIRESLP